MGADSALRTLSSLRGLRGAPEVPPLCRETSASRTANVGTVGKNWLINIYLSCEEGHGASVDPGEVGSGGHGLEVVLALLGGDLQTLKKYLLIKYL